MFSGALVCLETLVFIMKVSIILWVPPNGWFIMEKPIKMDDLGVSPFQETSICAECVGCCL